MQRFLVYAAILVAGLAGLIYCWTRIPNRWWYRDGRPTAFGRWTNAFQGVVYRLGVTPRWMATLEVRRRRSGKLERLPVVVADYEGERYLVSMLREKSAWVRNVRAADGAATLWHGTAEPIHLVEVPAEQRAPIIKIYLERAIGARPHFPIEKDAPVHAFEEIAAAYPVFRVEPRRELEGVGV
jgi:hypothetical protein